MAHRIRLAVWLVLVAGPALGMAAAGALGMLRPGWLASVGLLALTIWTAYAAYRVHAAVAAPLRTTAALLQGLREGNFSVRARGDGQHDDVGVLLAEFNALATWLQARRLTDIEASALLATVMSELESAVLAFDGRQVLRLANPAAARLFTRPVEDLLGRSAAELGCERLLEPQAAGLMSLEFPGAVGRWEVRHSSFRQDGLAHHLVVLHDVSRALREEERLAWRRLIRVLSHELNNSLTPITSIANSLGRFVARAEMDEASRDDVQRGLGVIESRAQALNRFLKGYATLAKLPPPAVQDVSLSPLVTQVAALQRSPSLRLAGGPDVTVRADPDQLEQLLINLVRNGLDAVQETGGAVQVEWETGAAGELEVRVVDEGPGVAAGADVFVPFFTTKPGGTGIGLALCRQIADAHGWQVTLENRTDVAGCVARLRVPLT
ncbi:ATP-binding protein [Luteitalea sp.]|uniref:sensor histidine kinase n=1 Tax=Luteitalea sp. TaxID=2004800 RepID=UPI0025C29488|nr:ATP-binding protein [Luteitalea sp.]